MPYDTHRSVGLIGGGLDKFLKMLVYFPLLSSFSYGALFSYRQSLGDRKEEFETPVHIEEVTIEFICTEAERKHPSDDGSSCTDGVHAADAEPCLCRGERKRRSICIAEPRDCSFLQYQHEPAF